MSPDLTHDQRRAQGLDVLRTLRGGAVDAPAVAQQMEANLGALGSFVLDFGLGDVWSRPQLSRRDRSLIVVSILTALNQLTQLRAHVAGGLNHGLTPVDVEEIMVQLCAYVGFPRALDGMTTVQAVLRDRAGVEALPAHQPATPKGDAQRRADGRAVLAGLLGRALPESGGGGALGAVGEFAMAFAFGEVWSRPQLSRRDRSLVVCAALTALGRVEELRFHVPGALNHGCTRAEVEELMLQACVYAGWPAGVEGMRAAQEAFQRLDAPSGGTR